MHKSRESRESIDEQQKAEYENLSADDLCPDCEKLRDENGNCLCEPKNKIDQIKTT